MTQLDRRSCCLPIDLTPRQQRLRGIRRERKGGTAIPARILVDPSLYLVGLSCSRCPVALSYTFFNPAL